LNNILSTIPLSARSAGALIALNYEPRALQNATYFLWAFGHGVLAWIWLDKACQCSTMLERLAVPTSFYAGKVQACRYFFECELPKIEPWLGVVDSLSDVATSMPVDHF
jgi:hypothetical protein